SGKSAPCGSCTISTSMGDVTWESPGRSGERRSDARHQCLRDLDLRLRRPGFHTLAGDKMDGVTVAAHHAGLRRYVISNDPVAALATQFLFCVFDDILGFGGEP